MPQSPLHDELKKAGATFGEDDGWEVARHYGDVAAEHRAVRETLGLYDASPLTKIAARGRDALEYFHRRLSNSVLTLRPGQGCEACLLQGDGRLIAHLTVLAREEELLLTASPLVRAPLFHELNRLIIMEDCALEDVSDRYAALEIHGARADEFVQRACGADAEKFPHQCFLHAEAECLDTPIIIARHDILGAPGYRLLVPAATAGEAFGHIWREVRACDGRLFGADAYQSLRVEAGTPRFGAELTTKTFPQEAGLERAIDFNKGCFPGQEICARIKNFGHPSRVLAGLKLDGAAPPAPGAAVGCQGVPAGQITTGAYSPTLDRAIALALLLWEHREPGTELEVGPLRAVVCELPMNVSKTTEE